MSRRARWVVCAVLLLSVAGCRISEDAALASRQMTDTAAALGLYYGALAAAETDSLALLEVDGAVSGAGLDAAQRNDIAETRESLRERQHLAEALAELADRLSRLTRSTAPGDVATAATGLGSALVSAKALPSSPPIPAALGNAGKLLLTLAQEREERKAAQAMDATLAALAELFEKEQSGYNTVLRFRVREAGVVAGDLATAKGVDVTPMLLPALRPFDLQPLPADARLQARLQALVQQRVQERVGEQSAAAEAATTAMLHALQEMSTRVHTLATDKRWPSRGDPVSLATVKGWLAAVS